MLLIRMPQIPFAVASSFGRATGRLREGSDQASNRSFHGGSPPTENASDHSKVEQPNWVVLETFGIHYNLLQLSEAVHDAAAVKTSILHDPSSQERETR